MTETQIQSQVLRVLGQLGGVRFWRNRQSGRGKLAAGLGTGTADIVGVVRMPWGTEHAYILPNDSPIGRWCSFEVKAGKGKASPEQAAHMAEVRRLGGFACIVRSPQDAIAAVGRCREGKSE